jgi:hypothetical protein
MLMTEPALYAEYRRLGSQITATASMSTGSHRAATPTSLTAVSGQRPKRVPSLVEANVLQGLVHSTALAVHPDAGEA